MKKVLISAGPIPAKLDSVKYIGNRFKGRLTLSVAEKLSLYNNFEITLIKWRFSDLKNIPENVKVVNIDDIIEYYNYITTSSPYDAYILAGAVANLMPVSPWEGKFPSHNYHEGDEFDIKFTIAPRIIDQVKKRSPRATLIGYKLFDGTQEELISAARSVLRESKANVVFANSPKEAKYIKFAVMPDGSSIKMTFDEHVYFIARMINTKWFSSKIIPSGIELNSQDQFIFNNYPRTGNFGTFAIRKPDGSFLTTTRGKTGVGVCKVFNVIYGDVRKVCAAEKATLNAPLLANIFNTYKEINFVLHNHRKLKDAYSVPYRIPGTEEDTLVLNHTFNIEHHGYIKSFKDFKQVKEFITNELEYVF